MDVPKLKPVRPFLNWAGGKSRQARLLAAFSPPAYNRYFEPFLGAGSVFFSLKPPHAMLSDANEELINCFIQVKDQPEQIVARMDHFSHERATFEYLKKLDPSTLTPIERSVRFIYLNKASFNAVYRVNKSGHYNVPFGRRSATIARSEVIYAASEALQGSVIVPGDFEFILKHARPEDFVYMDPPYYPASPTANFTKYTEGSFTEQDHGRVFQAFTKLDERGCYVMMTNASVDPVLQLYEGYIQRPIKANRWVNANGAGRRALEDVVVMNYTPSGEMLLI